MSQQNLAEPSLARPNFDSALSPRLGVLAVYLILFFIPQLAFADHIHHLWYNNSTWQDQDLTALTGGPGANGGELAAIAAFRTIPNDQLHVYYVDPNDHMRQLYYNGASWSDQDLTALADGPPAQPFSVSGFAIGNLQYVFYLSNPSFHVHELYYNNSTWQDQDLTALVGGSLADGPLVAFATTVNNQFHVYYVDLFTLDLHQLYFNGTSWSDQDLTAIMGGGAQCGGFWASGFAVKNEQHIFCDGTGTPTVPPDLLHIYYNNSTWVYEDLTLASGSQQPNGAGPAAFKVCTNQWEVYSVNGDHAVNNDFTHLFHVDGMWIGDDLTNRIGALNDSNSGQIVAFVTKPNDQYHIYYAPSTEVYQVYFNGSAWKTEDLTGGNGNADPNAGMAGFAIGNLQHVFYMSNN